MYKWSNKRSWTLEGLAWDNGKNMTFTVTYRRPESEPDHFVTLNKKFPDHKYNCD